MSLSNLNMMYVLFCASTIHITLRHRLEGESSVGLPLGPNVVFIFQITIAHTQ